MNNQIPNDIGDQLKSLFQSRDFPKTLQLALTVIKHEPKHAQANITIAKLKLIQGLYQEAGNAAHIALEALPESGEVQLLLAKIYSQLGQSDKSLHWCNKFISKNPMSHEGWQQHANVLERIGDLKNALISLNKSKEISANPILNWLAARCLTGSGDHKEAISEIDEGLSFFGMENPTNNPIRSKLLLQRAKILDRLKQYEEAYQNANTAKKLVAVVFDQGEYVNKIDEIIEVFSSTRLQRLQNYTESKKPHIFIVGMPRSGTTLVEQILDAHPDATGVGEFKGIDQFSRSLQKNMGSWASWPKCATDLSAPLCENLVKHYEKSLLDHNYPETSTFVNKNLKNMQLLGLIAILFPNSKVIFTHRDTRDVGISCFMGSFSPQVHPELMSMENIGLMIKQFERLREHWKSVLPLEYLDIKYEDIIFNQESTTRKMIDFCGLPWDNKCLEFYKSKRTVMTLSYDQVNKPIYSSSIGRYLNYKDYIDPLDN